MECVGEVHGSRNRVRQSEQPPERVDTVKELEVGPDRHSQVGDGLSVGVLAAVTVVGE